MSNSSIIAQIAGLNFENSDQNQRLKYILRLLLDSIDTINTNITNINTEINALTNITPTDVIEVGQTTALAADVTGTTVTLTKVFSKINTIVAVCSVSAAHPYSCQVKFTLSTVNPTTFLIFAYDDTGTRVDSPVNWAAIGIVY